MSTAATFMTVLALLGSLPPSSPHPTATPATAGSLERPTIEPRSPATESVGEATAPAAAVQGETEPPLVTDRPDFTESAEIVPPGRVQVEGGYTFARADDVDSHALGELLARIPVHRRVELRAGINSFVLVRPPAPGGDHSGLEDSSIGIKWKLLDGDPGTGLDRPDVALLASTTLPTGDDRLGEDDPQPDVALALAWDLSERVALGTNVGWAGAVDGDDRYGQGFGSVALGLGITGRFGTFLEWFGLFPGSADGSDLHFVNGGVTWLVDGDLQLDARIGKGLNGIDDDFFVGTGASIRF